MEFIKNSRFQSAEWLVVKLFVAGGKPRPKGAREVLPTLENSAQSPDTVQTSPTSKTQQILALQTIPRVMAWAVHWANPENPFALLGELP
ncbi:hypothetical protein [Pseudomonas sp. FW305-3-2-15-C-TSA2]|uniref:hypothetical protein n=1 Tax=Pseudomonas sp. FW305-3-2-15-C-TSA2 TaxID=2751334 RepID=UPI001C43C374|nr:hypothetical protein [Pseudomonas sp. FW305-3-2-15-C-TSA2]